MMIVRVHQVQVFNVGTAFCQSAHCPRIKLIINTPALRVKDLVDPAEVQADQLGGVLDSSFQQRLEHLWPQRRAAAEAELLWTVSLQRSLQGQGIQPGARELQGLQVSSLTQTLSQRRSSRPVSRVWPGNRHEKNSEMLRNINAEHCQVEQEQGLVYLRTSTHRYTNYKLHNTTKCIAVTWEHLTFKCTLTSSPLLEPAWQ